MCARRCTRRARRLPVMTDRPRLILGGLVKAHQAVLTAQKPKQAPSDIRAIRY